MWPGGVTYTLINICYSDMLTSAPCLHVGTNLSSKRKQADESTTHKERVCQFLIWKVVVFYNYLVVFYNLSVTCTKVIQ